MITPPNYQQLHSPLNSIIPTQTNQVKQSKCKSTTILGVTLGILLMIIILLFATHTIGSKSSNTCNNINTTLNIHKLISAYQTYSYLSANVDPLNYLSTQLNYNVHLDPNTYHLSDDDTIEYAWINENTQTYTVKELINKLNTTYVQNIGYEYGHVVDAQKREWLIQHIEGEQFSSSNIFKNNTKSIIPWQNILYFLIESDTFASFVKKVWPDAWTFPMSGKFKKKK
jgi:2-oxoglutarate dehydrogenase complex dehydrogenase (E1) component-like enzyme